MPPEMIGMGAQMLGGLVGSIGKLFTAHKQMKMANAINPVRQFYKTSQYALDNKGMYQNAMNGNMPGQGSMEQGINSAQSNTINAANRSATNSADALAIAAGSQGTANRATEQLGTMENQWKDQQMNNVAGANRDLTNEEKMKYQDQLDYYKEQMATKNALMGASLQNNQSGIGGIGTGLMMGGNALMTAKSADGKPWDWKGSPTWGINNN